MKPQSAFFERHGWRGFRTLGRLIAEARSAGLLVVLDVKRGDVGSTNEAYLAFERSVLQMGLLLLVVAALTRLMPGHQKTA